LEFSVLPVLDVGGSALSTCEVRHERAELLTTWRQLLAMEAERAARIEAGETLPPMVVFLDEITSALPSRQAMSLPPQLARLFNQLRKVNVQLVWTAPNWARADKLLREVTGLVTVCRGLLPERGGDGWGANRLFRFKTYAAEDFDEFTLAKTVKLRAVHRRWYWRPRHRAHELYRTMEPVQLLDHVDDYGVCINCGGTRARARCSCKHTEEASPAATGAPPGAPAPLVPVPVVVSPALEIDEWERRFWGDV
jgi:hypothetical protein